MGASTWVSLARNGLKMPPRSGSGAGQTLLRRRHALLFKRLQRGATPMELLKPQEMLAMQSRVQAAVFDLFLSLFVSLLSLFIAISSL